MSTPTTIKLTKVPRQLYPSHEWLFHENNRDALRIFLEKHKVDIAAVYNIEFRNNGFTVSQYLLDEGGKKKIDMKLGGRVGEVLTETIEHDYLPGLKPKLLQEGRARSG